MLHSLKIWERVIENRLRGTVTMSDQQFGLMPSRSTTDAIFALRQLMEKCRKGKRSLHYVFIDLEKAYDRVQRMEVWNCLREKEVDEDVIRLIQDMYEGSRSRIRTVAGVTEDFEVKLGLHQGLALSPLLFAIVMHCITGPLQRDAPWDMLFSDYCVLCGETCDEVERRPENWKKTKKDRGMRVSRGKTEYLCLDSQED